MRLSNRILLMALFVCVTHSGLKTAPRDDDWASEVKAAANLILSNSSKPEGVLKSLVRLLDTAIRITSRDAQMPAEFRNRLQAVQKEFAANPLGAEGGTALKEAYKVINGGKDFTFPNEVKSIGDASRIARQHIDRSLNLIESGQPGKAVREILAFILLVTTPVMR